MAAFIDRKVAELGGRQKLTAEQLEDIEIEAHEQWLFPDWKVYVKNTGEIKWSHVLTKAFTYGIEKAGDGSRGPGQLFGQTYLQGVSGRPRRAQRALAACCFWTLNQKRRLVAVRAEIYF